MSLQVAEYPSRYLAAVRCTAAGLLHALISWLNHLLATPGNEDAIDVQGHDREGVVDPIRVYAQESDNVGVNPMPSSSPSMVSYQRPAPELLQAVQAALQLHHQA